MMTVVTHCTEQDLEGSTIPQLIVWSETADCAQTLSSILDDIDDQLAVMQGWLEAHGRPLEVSHTCISNNTITSNFHTYLCSGNQYGDSAL
jgi:hypothetical protein